MQVPRLEKIVVNIGIGEAIPNAKALDAAVERPGQITGQKPIVTKAKKSIAAVQAARPGMPIGVTVTLRGERMYEFLDRLFNAALPRAARLPRRVRRASFDGRGNYTLGPARAAGVPGDRLRQDRQAAWAGGHVVTTARTDQEARRLLELLGMPFQRAGPYGGDSAILRRRDCSAQDDSAR